ncbi:hypothetical protein [Gemmata sp.]|uniref:hypothetical protein n=1 Tax=Gemmata sp. TaxID=1914242 RepID=UPI003F70520C
MSCQPEGLPNHVHLADGVVQINDRAGFGQGGGFSALGGDFGIDRFGPSGQRQVTEQWGTDATTDPERLYDLQCLYRVALGTTPMPPPNSIAYLRRNPPSEPQKGKSGRDSSGGTTSTGGGGSTPSGGESGSNDANRRVPLDVMLTDVPPPGWYRVGCKKDVPKDACYVGRWGDRYAWVTAGGVPELARFTTTVLLVIKLKPGERAGGKNGLAITGGN